MVGRPALLRVLLVAAAALPLLGLGDRADVPIADRPGPVGAGVTLLPNGWRIAPVGRHLDAGDLPLAIALHPDGRHLVITNNGYSKPSLRVVDLERLEVVQKMPLDHAWLGLVWHPDGRRLFSSGAADNSVSEIEWRNGRLAPGRTFTLAPPQKRLGDERLENPGFVGGLALSPQGGTLYAAHVFGESLAAVDTETGRVLARAPLPAEAYTTLVSPDGRTVYVSVWGAARVALFEPVTLRPLGEIAVGEHPNAMALSKDGRHLLVACANTNAVWVVDVERRKAVEQIGIALRPDALPGSTPNALALSPDGATLLVANADNNTVAVVDVRRPGESRPLGLIPTGWYPTGVAFDASGRNLLLLSGKGLSPAANPRGPQPVAEEDAQYIGRLLNGALTVLPRPDEAALRAMTDRVYSLSATGEGRVQTPPATPEGAPLAGAAGLPPTIKHIFYVVRENRTYDQVLGDVPKGNGDPNLTLFGEEVTPNAHALATEFVLFDNFYVDAEVSHDGHSYSMAAYATDANEKLWPTQYAGRGGLYLGEGGYRMRNPYGNLTAPARGYLWDFAARAGVSVRSYGEFATWDSKGGPVRASVPGLEGKVHPSFAPFDLSIPDNQRVDVWLEELRRFEKEGGLPQLNILHLGNDHTTGTTPGDPTPRAFVAENDLALGRFVEAVSKSRFWPESAIFVLEDDAQNGPDHVDAHRSVLLVASPWTRRAAVDHTLYTTSGVLRTIELILGLPPMSQYDAAATPLSAAFASRPDLTPYAARPARVSLEERNEPDAPGAQASLRMDFAGADLTPERELNEILWKSVRGADAVMPPPVRAAFVRPVADADDEQDRE
jgi:YVTN family beta-propeller protein